ncbi:MAG: hypothetical protein RIR70_2078 [Pseudomonadota bacterium]
MARAIENEATGKPSALNVLKHWVELRGVAASIRAAEAEQALHRLSQQKQQLSDTHARLLMHIAPLEIEAQNTA